MPLKRETSTTVSDLHLSTFSDSIKRLAISCEGQPTMAFRIQHPEQTTTSVLTVLSKASDDFHGRYDIIREIGKGGFSTVYQCRSKQSGVDYAVKVRLSLINKKHLNSPLFFFLDR
jgi:hypothetical protein